MTRVRNNLRGRRGFTLVEILVVIAIFGVVMSIVYTLYLVQRKTAFAQEEVAEVQQNLRIAMDSISRDIRMSGALIPIGSPPVSFANSSTVTLSMASADGVYARIATAYTTAATPTIVLNTDSPESVDAFTADPATGDIVRLIRPLGVTEPMSGLTFRVTASNRATPSITLARTDGVNFAPNVIISPGDMIAKIASAGAPYPNTVTYRLTSGGGCPAGQRCLARELNGVIADNVIAQNMSTLAFSYLLDDPDPETSSPTTLTRIKGVRVTINGSTAANNGLLSGMASTRQITSEVMLRNRR